MERITTAIIGGGASGLFLATALSADGKTWIFERGERLGRKLSATGNGQGNITNLAVTSARYFSVEGSATEFASDIIRRYDGESLRAYFASLGVLLSADERGRVYPSSRQASALTDALRFAVQERGVNVRLGCTVTAIERANGGFLVKSKNADGQDECIFAERVVVCAGGKAAKNFGTDGNAYALAEGLGHSVTKLYPSLVQIKTDTAHTKTLKGIRVNDGKLTAKLENGECVEFTGDVIFTDYGISGDAVFRASAFIAAELPSGTVKFLLDFLPNVSETEIYTALQQKRQAFPELAFGELLFGIVNNQIGRAVMKCAEGDLRKAAALVKGFPLQATGSLGFDYAQVTKGGIPLSEVTKNLESCFAKGLYFTGEILDVDGQCGGFNLQWAYSSAMLVADALNAQR